MSTKIPPHVFRAYDIRGLAFEELSASFAYRLGRALAEETQRRGGERATFAYDIRHSSYELAMALAAGMSDGGLQVVSQGMGPTPLLYFAVETRAYDLGVMVTGSHNPPQDNGFKIVFREGAAFGEEILRLYERMRVLEALSVDASSASFVQEVEEECLRDAYVDAVIASVRPAPRPMRVSLDAGSGAAGPLAMRVLQRLGYEVVGHAIEPDGDFPIHHPDPTAEESLRYMAEAVQRDGSIAGLGLDGDGDRLSVVDERGEVLMGDRLLAFFAEDVLRGQPGATVLGEVKCSRVLFDHVRQHGGHAVMGRVGHSVMKAQMRTHRAVLAGEVTGHFFFADRWYGFDDGVYAAARFLEWLGEQNQKLSVLGRRLPQTFATPELRIECAEAEKFECIRLVRDQLAALTHIEEVDGVRAEWDDGWGLIRASNTEAVLVVRAEAHSLVRLEEIVSLLRTLILGATTDA